MNYLDSSGWHVHLHCLLQIFKHDTNDSNSATPPTNENEEYCFDILNDSAIDDDSLLLDSPPCGTIVSSLWEDAHDIK